MLKRALVSLAAVALLFAGSATILASGVIESRQHWMDYSRPEGVTVEVTPTGKLIHQPPSTIERPGWWWVGHLSTGILGVLIAGWHLPLMVVGQVYYSDIVLIFAAVIVFNWVFNNFTWPAGPASPTATPTASDATAG